MPSDGKCLGGGARIGPVCNKENIMKLRALASLLVASSLVAVAGTASAQAADTTRVMGLRFETTLFQPFDVRGITGFNPDEGPSSPRFDVFRPQGDIRIGYDLPMGLTPMIGFGLRSANFVVYDADDNEVGGMGRTDIVLSVEARYYFGPHSRGLQPFVFGEWNTTIASFGATFPENADEEDVKEAEFVNKGRGDKNSVMNLNAGLGMEYKFARNFAVGGKWGFGISLAPTSREERSSGGTTRVLPGTSNTVWGTSSSIYLAFRI